MLASGIDDLVGDAPVPSRANEPTCVNACSLELVEGIADRRGDLTGLVNVPGKAPDVIALAHREHEHLTM
jgi:hypothetical protein